MKVLVTGASGFIGKNVLLATPKDWQVVATSYCAPEFTRFLEENALHNVIPLPVDLTIDADLDKIAAIADSFDACLFLAANGDPAVSVRQPSFDLISNSVTLVKLLERISFRKFIFFSSGAVYDGLEGAVSPSVNVHPRLPYAISKLNSENYLKFFHHHGKIEQLCILRFFGAYGPYEPSRKIYSKLVQQFAIKRDPHFTITGDGKNLIDAMYIDDAVKAIILLLASLASSMRDTFDLHYPRPITLKELVEEAARVFDLEADVSFQGMVPEYINFFSEDDFMEREFGYVPRISLHEGLLKLYEHLSCHPS